MPLSRKGRNIVVSRGQTLFRTGRYRLEMISARAEKGLVRFTALTCSGLQHGGARC